MVLTQSDYNVPITSSSQILVSGVGGKRIQLIDWALLLDSGEGIDLYGGFFFGPNSTDGYFVATAGFHLQGTYANMPATFWTPRLYVAGAMAVDYGGQVPYIGDVGESLGIHLAGSAPTIKNGSFIYYGLVDG